MSIYGDMTLDEYRDALSSSEPTPGGGTAAAVALSQGAALAVMVCNLTLKSDKWEDGWVAANECLSVANPLLERGHELAHEDAHSFDGVMDAFRMPKSNDEEIELRRAAIHSGTLDAANVPLQTAKLALELLESLPALAQMGNSNAVTDVGVAGLLSSAACKGALFNVEINLNSIPTDMGMEQRVEMNAIREKCQKLSRSVMQTVNEKMRS